MATINKSVINLTLPVSRLDEKFPSHFDGRFPFQKPVTDEEGVTTWQSWTIAEMIEDEAYKAQFGGTQTRVYNEVEYAWVTLPFDPLEGDFDHTALWSFGQGKSIPEGTTWSVDDINNLAWEDVSNE